MTLEYLVDAIWRPSWNMCITNWRQFSRLFSRMMDSPPPSEKVDRMGPPRWVLTLRQHRARFAADPYEMFDSRACRK